MAPPRVTQPASDRDIHTAVAEAALPPPPWRTLGAGVWGDVFDLGDGTVLKAVRETGGIGAGADILEGEVAALKAVDGLGGHLRAATLLASSLDRGAPALPTGYCGWIHMSKLAGETAQTALGRAAAAQPGAALMHRIGQAAALFHQRSGDLTGSRSPFPAVSQQRLNEIADIVPDMKTACAEVGAVLAAGPQHPFLHGDINGGNVLIDAKDGLAASTIGLVDWGEAQTGPIEIELRHMHDMGGPADAMADGYESVAGTKPDPGRLAAALCLNALGTLAIATLGTVRGLDPVRARTTVMDRLAALDRA